MAVRTGQYTGKPAQLGLAAIVTLFSASCHQCFGPQTQTLSPPPLALLTTVQLGVVLTPSSTVLLPGASVQFSAMVKMSDGTVVPASMVWTATGGTVTAGGLYTAGTTPGTYRVSATIDGGIQADTSTVTVTPPTATGLVVQASGVPALQEKWLLQDTDISAAGMGTCPSDLVTSFTQAEQTVTDVWPGCATELTVFASGFAPVLDVAPAPVVIAGKTVITEPLPAAWTVRVRVVIEYTGARAEAAVGIALAKTLFDANAMGLTPKVVEIDSISPDIDPATGKVDLAAMAIKQGCAAVAAQTGLVDADRLNVYYVRGDQWNAAWKTIKRFGYNCYLEVPSHPNIIFLTEGHLPATLAHEIGHALNLGHVGFGTNLSGWSPRNLMRPSVFDTAASQPVDQFTLGQAYRANVDSQSWLNLGKARSGTIKVCPSPGVLGVHWPCPDVQLNW